MRSTRRRPVGDADLLDPLPTRPAAAGRPLAPGRPAPIGPAPVETWVDAALHEVRDLLAQDVAERLSRAQTLAPVHAALWREVAGQIGGRLLRPRLTLAAYHGLGGWDVAAVAPVAAAQEMLHTAMLVHDDLLDHDETRRGRPNVTGAARRRLAERGVTGRAAQDQVLAAGVLGGDVALAAAFDLVASAPVDPELRVQAVRALAAAIDTSAAGELLDVSGALRGTTEVDALRVAELKTAVYSCCAPLAAGALLVGAGPQVRAALDRYGVALGVAFQLLDDELGVFGDPAMTGKSALSDLREGKRTELLRLAYLRADAGQRAVLDAEVGRPGLDEPAADRVRTVIETCGALHEARLVRHDAMATARAAAREGLPAPLAGYLVTLVDALGLVGGRE
ncbi:MAG TPA: polyprenyl synthetase family protein [Cellulomonas sp.]